MAEAKVHSVHDENTRCGGGGGGGGAGDDADTKNRNNPKTGIGHRRTRRRGKRVAGSKDSGTATASASAAASASATAMGDRTATELALASVREYLDGGLQALGAGSAEAIGKATHRKKQKHRLEKKFRRAGHPAPDVAAATALADPQQPIVVQNEEKESDGTKSTTVVPHPPKQIESDLAPVQGMIIDPKTNGEAAAPMTTTVAATATAEAATAVDCKKKGTSKKDKQDLVSRYIVLLICVVAVVLALIGMSVLSWSTHGTWWHSPPPNTLQHTPLF